MSGVTEASGTKQKRKKGIHRNQIETLEELKSIDLQLYHYLMANHYSKFVDLDDEEFKEGKF